MSIINPLSILMAFGLTLGTASCIHGVHIGVKNLEYLGILLITYTMVMFVIATLAAITREE